MILKVKSVTLLINDFSQNKYFNLPISLYTGFSEYLIDIVKGFFDESEELLHTKQLL